MIIFFLGVSLTNYVNADDINPGVFPINSKPYGLTYGEWAAKWWQWIMSIPAKDNPRLDITGEKCSVAQSDQNVWFLAQTPSGPVQRDCIIPPGKAILVPLLTGECDYLSDPTVRTETDLRRCAFSGIQGATIRATLDGTNMKNLERYRVKSPLFDLTIPSDNSFGSQGSTGTTKAVADGYYLMLEPLSIGRHTLRFSASIVDNPTLGTFSYASDVKYNIEVK
jgi:hypothetical protein